jgi:ABC-type dipeptide/oligopeptide/nickel transport system permease subunit
VLDARARARFSKNRGAVFGLVLVALLMIFAIVGPWIATHDAYTSDFARGATEDGIPVGPSSEFWLGTDRLFRDQFVRLASGARISLIVAFAATAISSILGAAAGIAAGWYEGTAGIRIPWASIVLGLLAIGLVIFGMPRTAGFVVVFAIIAMALRRSGDGPRLNADVALMRLVDVGLSFPFLLLVMAIGAALDKTSMGTILITLGITSWLGTARVLRAKTMQVRGLDFVVAARALGQPTRRILVRHILPNVAGPLIVIATAQVAQMIVAESVLSYLGVGISPPAPTWGHMLYEGQDNYLIAPWMLAAPIVAILVAVLGFNLLGEGLRDALDPKD